jgi:hypothetical protein
MVKNRNSSFHWHEHIRPGTVMPNLECKGYGEMQATDNNREECDQIEGGQIERGKEAGIDN